MKETKAFVKEVANFFEAEGAKVPLKKVFLGSSECIESVIGKYKILEERGNATRSITRNIIAMGALMGKCSEDSIREAFTSISIKKMNAWVANRVGITDLAKRRALLVSPKLVGTRSTKISGRKC